MSCNHCSTKFNFFNKELGCSNCGLSLCSKCKIPIKGNGEFNVCRTCYNQLTSDAKPLQPQRIFPPDIFLKILTCENPVPPKYVSYWLWRLENLENPAAPPITMYKQDSKILNLRRGLSAADQKLVDRLEKLKEDGKGPPPSESEIRQRLAHLKGETQFAEGPSKPVYIPDTRTDQEKIDSLLEQFTNERGIEVSQNPEGPQASNLDETHDSEEEVDRITRKVMDEVALDERAPIKLSSKKEVSTEEEPERTSPELPWCVLCNNDAKYRCLDCSGDLYCKECNIEVHKNWGETDHKVVPYQPQ